MASHALIYRSAAVLRAKKIPPRAREAQTHRLGPFARVAKKAGLEEITIYALQHSNIVRQLLAGVPVRVVAVNHDTSIRMIERTYSRYIGDHADALTRAALLDTSTTPRASGQPGRKFLKLFGGQSQPSLVVIGCV